MASLWSTLVGYFSSHGGPSAPPTSTNAPSLEDVESIVIEILEIYLKLKNMESLKPCDEVDELFERLVNHCVLNRSSEVTDLILQDPRLREIEPDLRRVCDVAECCLEFHWAEIIIGSEKSISPEEVYSNLTLFPYFQNYVDLTKLELCTIYGVRNSPSPIVKIAFLGSGPLPLTSLCLCGIAGNPLNLPNIAIPPITVFNIDNNPLAISKSRILCQKLGDGARGMEFVCSDAVNSEIDLRDFDVVYLAALVGSTQAEKEGVLINVVERMSEGALLIVRSANRLRTLLYSVFDPSSEVVRRYLDICAMVHPYNHVVNSVAIGRVKRRGSEGIDSKRIELERSVGCSFTTG